MANERNGIFRAVVGILMLAALPLATWAQDIEITGIWGVGPSTEMGQGTVHLEWTGDPNAEGFEVFRTAENGGDYGLGYVNGATGTGNYSWDDNSVDADITYSYRIRGRYAGGVSDFCEPVSIVVPRAPVQVRATALSNTSVRLNWVKSPSYLESVQLLRSQGDLDADGNRDYGVLRTLNFADTTFLDDNLTTGTHYSYYLKVISAQATATSLIADVVTILPPRNVDAQPLAGGRMRICWQPVTGATSYRVYRAESANSEGLCFAEVSECSAEDSSLEGATQYFYRVRACLDGIESGSSPVASNITGAAPPSSISASALSNKSMQLVWTAMRGAEYGYDIYRTSDPDTTYTLVGTAAINSYVDDQRLSEATRYWYMLRTRGLQGTSDLSAPASGWTGPNPPSGLVVLPDDAADPCHAMLLTWIDNSQKEDGFVVERSPNGVDSWIEFAVGPAAGTGGHVTFRDQVDVAEGKHYWYRVKAYLSPAP